MNIEKTPEERRLEDIQAIIDKDASTKPGELANIILHKGEVHYALAGKLDGSYSLLVTDLGSNKKYLFKVNNQGTLTDEKAWDLYMNENTGRAQKVYTQTPREVDVKFDDLLMGL